MKYKTIVAIAALSAAGGAFAAEAVRQAVLSWTKPTQYTDGSPIDPSVVVTYNVYKGARGSTSKTRIAEGVTELSRTITGLELGEHCFNVTAVAHGLESAYSQEGCKSFPFLAPAAPPLVVD